MSNHRPETSHEPTFAELLEWLENRLPAPEAARIEHQVATGRPYVQRQVDWLRAYLAASKHVQFASSPALRERLMQLFERRISEQRSPSLFRRYLAALTNDSRKQLGAVGGLRGTALGNSRQLLYSTDVADIVINLTHTGGQNHIHGQIFAATDGEETPVVQLLRNDVEAAITFASDTGYFTFADVAPGHYTLVAATREYEVLVDAVPVES